MRLHIIVTFATIQYVTIAQSLDSISVDNQTAIVPSGTTKWYNMKVSFQARAEVTVRQRDFLGKANCKINNDSLSKLASIAYLYDINYIPVVPLSVVENTDKRNLANLV